MTERFGLDRKIRRSESANDQNASQIFGSNSAYSGSDESRIFGSNSAYSGSDTLD